MIRESSALCVWFSHAKPIEAAEMPFRRDVTQTDDLCEKCPGCFRRTSAG
ncbi:hypothetical protein RBWH47_01911 [Rhodopirellula baltica WH47]|uniref:Uncharacterized protein n=1 Tax=Rhodopirellula baltica WH47 TaxID=991778 RepID=F2ALS2_RHOBT|nr:hypothetical protein RBWH47_01911 [Rhodopirellula baltica WH47]